MARVFLSYAREDERRASQLAQALERAGHDVWWDRELTSGTRYSEKIEQALGDAHAVVVLWSASSVASPWVRDEAAAGRDDSKLVPASLDGTDPPLGFRQYHTTNLSRWRTEHCRFPGHPPGDHRAVRVVARRACTARSNTPVRTPRENVRDHAGARPMRGATGRGTWRLVVEPRRIGSDRRRHGRRLYSPEQCHGARPTG